MSTLRVYKYVLQHPGCTYGHVARDLGLTERQVIGSMAYLRKRGKVVGTWQHRHRYRAWEAASR